MSTPATLSRGEATTLRERAGLPLETALRGLERQSSLGLPVKLTVGANGAAALVAELPASRFATADEGRAALLPLVDEGLAWICDGGRTNPDSGRAHLERVQVREALEALGLAAVEDADGSFTVKEEFGCTRGGRFLADACGNGFVRVAQPVALAVVDAEPPAAARRALSALALEVNARLRLGRTSVEAVGGEAPDSFRLRWEAVIPVGRRLDRDFLAALAATAIAREATQSAYRALAVPEVAAAYLEILDRRWPPTPDSGWFAALQDEAASAVPTTT